MTDNTVSTTNKEGLIFKDHNQNHLYKRKEEKTRNFNYPLKNGLPNLLVITEERQL